MRSSFLTHAGDRGSRSRPQRILSVKERAECPQGVQRNSRHIGVVEHFTGGCVEHPSRDDELHLILDADQQMVSIERPDQLYRLPEARMVAIVDDRDAR